MLRVLRCLAFFALALGLGFAHDPALAASDQSLAQQSATNYLHAAAVPMQTGDYDRAVEILEEGLERSLATPEMLTLLGEAYRRQGRLNEAADAAEEALTMEPSYAPAHLQLGDVYMDLGWLESAADSYRAALAADDAAAAARSRLVRCLTEAGHPRQAEQECRAFLAREETPVLCLDLAEALARQQRHQAALTACDRALELDPRCAAAHARRARLFCELGDYEAATAASRAALAIDPQSAEAHASLGLASAHRDDFMGAYSHAVKAEQGGVDMSEVWSLLQRQN